MSREKDPQCLKIAQKVALNIASEASYVYISSGQKLIKNAKNDQFSDFLKTKACCQTVLPDRSILVENAKIKNMRHFEAFLNTV